MKRTLLALAVSLGLLALVLWGVDLEAAWARLREASPAWLGISLLASFAVLWARALRFWALTREARPAQVVGAIALQNFLVRVTPMRLGELSLPWLLHKHAGEPAGHSLVSLLLVRLLELWVLLVTAAGAALLWFGGAGSLRLGVVAGAVALLGLALVWFRSWLRWGVAVARWVAARSGAAEAPVVRKGFAQLDEALGESAGLSSKQRVGLGLGTLVVVALQFVLYGCLVRACGLDLHPMQLVVGAAAAQVAGALPVISVGSLGTHETGWTVGFVWVGLGLTDAVVSGLFTQVVTLAFAGLFALPAGRLLRG